MKLTGEEIIALAMKQRTEQGLKLVFFIPDQNRDYTCYPKDQRQKEAWLADAKRKGYPVKVS